LGPVFPLSFFLSSPFFSFPFPPSLPPPPPNLPFPFPLLPLLFTRSPRRRPRAARVSAPKSPRGGKLAGSSLSSRRSSAGAIRPRFCNPQTPTRSAGSSLPLALLPHFFPPPPHTPLGCFPPSSFFSMRVSRRTDSCVSVAVPDPRLTPPVAKKPAACDAVVDISHTPARSGNANAVHISLCPHYSDRSLSLCFLFVFFPPAPPSLDPLTGRASLLPVHLGAD